MKEIIHNSDNLTIDEITETVTRAKALIVNTNTKNILIGNENGFFEFPGGHLEENETLEECLKREVMEETGIELEDFEIKDILMKVTFMTRDWPAPGKNRRAESYFYLVETEKKPDMSKVTLTENEKNNNFRLETFPLNDSINIIKNNMPNNERNEILSPDMILVIEEYLKSLNKQL